VPHLHGAHPSDGRRQRRAAIDGDGHAPARADQTSVRRANLGVVLQRVAARGSCSRATIASETGLTRGTVSSLVAELIELGLLRETGEEERPGSVGRPARTLTLAGLAVGIGLEINVDYLAVCADDLAGRVLLERRVYADNRRSAPGPVLARLARMARAALAEVEAQGRRPIGIVCAVPGLVEVSSGTLLVAPNLGWSRIPVADELRVRIGLHPVRVENEANLAALAEHWYGVARGLRSFICVFGEVGVGAGIFVDGELYRGAHGFGGELGHVAVERPGASCACGSTGCLETVAGQEAIARRAGIRVASGGRARSVTDELARRAGRRDARVLASLREAGLSLGLALASTVNLFDVDAVVLGGCFAPLAPWLVDEVRAALGKRVLAADWSSCAVLASELGEGAAVRGAAALPLRDVLAAPWLLSGRQAGPLPAATVG
jgi:predicted NBD/HSP70 family sugar kinase